MTDKRVLPRATLRSLATVTSDAGVVECRIVNLSTSGMAFETDDSHDLGRFVHVTTNLGLGTPVIDLDAIVVRRELRGDRIIWGVSFEELPCQIISKIQTYVRKKSLDELA
jgi:hypothetical protein